MEYPVVRHDSPRAARWLREYRIRIALSIAVGEGILVVFDQIAGWVALAIAAIVLTFYVLVGRNLRHDTPRLVSWIAAMSQVFVALVPVLVFIIGTFALIAIAILAVVAVVALLADRR